MLGPRCLPSPKRSVRDLSSSARSRAARSDPGAAERRVLDPDPAAVRSTIERAMPRPEAAAAGARSRAASLRWKRSKTRSRSAGGMPGPVVVDRDDQPLPSARGREHDPAAGPGVAAGVGEQVADDLGDQVGVGAERALGELAEPRSPLAARPSARLAQEGGRPRPRAAPARPPRRAGRARAGRRPGVRPGRSPSSPSPRPGAPPRRSGSRSRASTSSWPRIAVSGLRSSCEASETNCRCRGEGVGRGGRACG